MNSFIKKIITVYVVCITALIIGFLADDDPALHHVERFIAEQKIDKSDADWKQKLPKPTQAPFAESKQYIWEMVTTKGPISIELWPQYAPMHVSSTMYLTKLGFYDGLTFHRVIPGFMAQGGDPTGTGRGNPGYRYDGEYHKDASHDQAGILSMANAGPGTDGAQFFITFKETRFLDGRHTVFGKVISGLETLSALEQSGSARGQTAEKLEILTATIVVKNK
ncbi:peptidylprolyl isomerase [Thalassotalea sp. HSM 43]|uniref:peptidylprolyl isomerase n=1 Tax=Thalassotalea sp. HSM 43 TaxID=2552945 RepID=UPI0010806368|nr:peptidylprolyl isomerase [Thalassotalea sp. HSM 43]QBY05026.1 peptidylprolyl isomerase [Thalassotalea sp. HSM 43]